MHASSARWAGRTHELHAIEVPLSSPSSCTARPPCWSNQHPCASNVATFAHHSPVCGRELARVTWAIRGSIVIRLCFRRFRCVHGRMAALPHSQGISACICTRTHHQSSNTMCPFHRPQCPMNCSGHGTCALSGLCNCMPGYAGAACDSVDSSHALDCPRHCWWVTRSPIDPIGCRTRLILFD